MKFFPKQLELLLFLQWNDFAMFITIIKVTLSITRSEITVHLIRKIKNEHKKHQLKIFTTFFNYKTLKMSLCRVNVANMKKICYL